MRPGPGVWVTSTIELVSPIAEGAMGSVWVAYHHRLETRVAVKFVSDKLGEDTAEALARFEREASTASQIKSAHVVQTYDSGVSSEGVPFMVMELLEGESLGNRLRRCRYIALEEAAAVLTQVSRALAKAHALGIVHRDIKPDNIFLCSGEDGILCKVLDFGIAKQTRLPSMDGLTTEGTMVGTPEYLSPEQVLEGAPVDYRADLWALAVLIYVAVTGALPYSGRTVGQLCLALAAAKHTAPSALRPSLPKGIDAWFQRALHRDPQRRHGSAQAMAVGLLRLLPEGTSGVDLGLGTAIQIEDTERHFGATADTHPAVKRPAAKLVGPLLLAVVLAAGAAVMLARSDDLSTASAAVLGSGLDRIGAIAEEAVANAPAAVIDLDAEPADEGSDRTDATRPQPVRRSWPGPPRAPEPEPEPIAAPERASPPPPSGGKDQGQDKVRGKEELGF